MKKIIMILSILLSVNCYTQEILTIGKVFDYNIGDEFQIKSNLTNQPPNAERLKIIGKSFSQNHDTVMYSIARNNYISTLITNPEMHLEYNFYKDTISISYTNLDSSIYSFQTDLLYDSLKNRYGNYFQYDTITDYYCESLTNGFSCQLRDFEPDYYTYVYGRGLGIVEESICLNGLYECNNPVWRKMFYYKKGESSCGIIDNTAELKTNKFDDFIKIYPNPVKNKIHIELNSIECFFTILDLKGNEMASGKSESKIFEFDISGFKNGPYLIRILTKDGNICKKIIIE